MFLTNDCGAVCSYQCTCVVRGFRICLGRGKVCRVHSDAQNRCHTYYKAFRILRNILIWDVTDSDTVWKAERTLPSTWYQ